MSESSEQVAVTAVQTPVEQSSQAETKEVEVSLP